MTNNYVKYIKMEHFMYVKYMPNISCICNIFDRSHCIYVYHIQEIYCAYMENNVSCHIFSIYVIYSNICVIYRAYMCCIYDDIYVKYMCVPYGDTHINCTRIMHEPLPHRSFVYMFYIFHKIVNSF